MLIGRSDESFKLIQSPLAMPSKWHKLWHPLVFEASVRIAWKKVLSIALHTAYFCWNSSEEFQEKLYNVISFEEIGK